MNSHVILVFTDDVFHDENISPSKTEVVKLLATASTFIRRKYEGIGHVNFAEWDAVSLKKMGEGDDYTLSQLQEDLGNAERCKIPYTFCSIQDAQSLIKNGRGLTNGRSLGSLFGLNVAHKLSWKFPEED